MIITIILLAPIIWGKSIQQWMEQWVEQWVDLTPVIDADLQDKAKKIEGLCSQALPKWTLFYYQLALEKIYGNRF